MEGGELACFEQEIDGGGMAASAAEAWRGVCGGQLFRGPVGFAEVAALGVRLQLQRRDPVRMKSAADFSVARKAVNRF